MNKMAFSERITRIIIFIWFSFYAVCIIYPLLWMFLSGFKTSRELFISTWSLPEQFKWQNYAMAWKIGVGKYFFNSILVTVFTVMLTILVSAFAAYALSRFEFRLREVFLMVIVGGLMLSPQVGLISLYRLLHTFGIYNTYLALIIPYVAYRVPFTVFLMRSYFLSLPREVEESAYIDGCGSFKVFWHIVLPMSKPILATSALLTAMFSWNEFMFALVFIEDKNLRTIPLGLMNMRGELTTNWPVLLAGLALSALPMIVTFILFQKQFIRGLTAGSLKG